MAADIWTMIDRKSNIEDLCGKILYVTPAAAFASVLVKSFATAATKAVVAVLAAKGVKSVFGDKTNEVNIPALEPCID